MSRFDDFTSSTGWCNRTAWDAVQEACWLAPGEPGIALRRKRYAPFFQQMGADVRIDQGCRFSSPWRIALDDGARLNREVIIEGSSAVHVGRNARIGHRVFIHSANHDVSDEGPEAFFERAHVFVPVWIGDNVLISANVTILPGAFVENGSFVAAGAVVTARRFVGSVRLAGVPARPLTHRTPGVAAITKPAPEVAFVGPRERPRTLEALKLLATALACPQVSVLADDLEMPPSVRAIIAFDNAAVAADRAIPIYTVAPGHPIEAREWADAFDMPGKVEREFVINGYGSARTLANTAAATYFYASNAYLKRPAETRSKVAGEWAVALALALLDPSAPVTTWREALERLGSLNQASGPELLSADTLNALVQDEVSRLGVPLASEFFRNPEERNFAKVRALFHGTPHLLPLWTWVHRTSNETVCTAFLEFMRPHMNAATRLAALGCAYALASQDNKARTIVETLLSDEWAFSDTCLIRLLPGSDSLAIQPVVAALMIWALCRENGEARCIVPPSQHIALSWEAVTPPRPDAADVLSGGLFDRDNRVISASLIENWLLLQELPECADAHYYLSDAAYQDPCIRIEAAWSEILKQVVLAAGCPYLKLRAWPAGYDFALSLRYDVDRDCSAAQVSNILRIQKELLHAACGSWYFFAEAKFNPHIRNILRGWNQEDALHLCRPGEGRSGRGATAHSGSNSEYWRGKSTTEGLAAAGATYGEAMLSRSSVARPGWLGESRSELWLTPPHYPLEGSTSEQTTKYFDQRLEAFRSQIASGGHVIVGSHPDCNQDILDEVLDREDLSRAWAVSVDVAVRRCKSVLDYGAVRIVNAVADPDTRTFVSESAIADLAIDVWLPNEAAPRTMSTQLCANVPRILRIKPVETAA
jgi:acetyltransferase-like isoleucine patch superfamily enzyme